MNSILEFLTRSSAPSLKEPPRLCQHNICVHIPYCLKLRGEQIMSSSIPPLSSPSSISTFEQFFNLPLGEPEASHKWDPDVGWRLTCNLCLKDRCWRCGGEDIVSVSDFREVLTCENGVVWICWCLHGFCPGRRVEIVSRCGGCGHGVCEGCFAIGGAGGGGVMCCVCGPVVVQGEVIEEQLLGQGGQGDELLLNEEIESVPESNIGEGFWTALAGIPISPELPFPDVLLDL